MFSRVNVQGIASAWLNETSTPVRSLMKSIFHLRKSCSLAEKSLGSGVHPKG